MINNFSASLGATTCSLEGTTLRFDFCPMPLDLIIMVQVWTEVEAEGCSFQAVVAPREAKIGLIIFMYIDTMIAIEGGNYKADITIASFSTNLLCTLFSL